jgi:hypothetical protein
MKMSIKKINGMDYTKGDSLGLTGIFYQGIPRSFAWSPNCKLINAEKRY